MESFLVAYGTIALAVTLFLIALVAVSFESVFWGIVAIAIVLAAYNGLATDQAIVTWITANPLSVVYLLIGYVLLGVGWSFVKWMFHVWRAKDKYIEERNAWLEREKLTEAEWRALEKTDIQRYEFIRRQFMRGRTELPKASRHKSRIIAWMIWWPASAVWTLIDDPVRRLFNWIYARVSNIYDKITKLVYGTAAEDFVQKAELGENTGGPNKGGPKSYGV